MSREIMDFSSRIEEQFVWNDTVESNLFTVLLGLFL